MAKIVVPNDKPTIQDAVNSACPGDTIVVMPGNYEESVIIGIDDLLIEGAATAGVNLYGRGTNDIGFMIVGDEVQIKNINISNFFIGIYIYGNKNILQCVNTMACKGFGAAVSGEENTVRDSTFNTSGMFGLNLGGKNHSIENNLINGNILGGIINNLEALKKCKIFKNAITLSPVGINFNHSDSTCNMIMQNVLTTDTGIYVASPLNKIGKNTFQNCVDAGMIINSQNNEITNNIITNGRNGIIVTDTCNNFDRQMIANTNEAAASFADGNNRFTSGIISSSLIGIRSVDDSNVFQNNVFVNVDRENVMV